MAPGLFVPALDEAAIGGDDLDGMACGEQRLLEIGKGGLFETGGGEYGNGKLGIGHEFSSFLDRRGR